MKSQLYRNAAIAVSVLGLLGIMVGCWEISVSFETVDTETTLPPDVVATLDVPPATVNPRSQTNKIGLNNTDSFTPAKNSTTHSPHQGTLRMSNQTNQPVRVALLARQAQVKNSSMPQNEVPAHWDFDPQEGSEQGLVLSLPDGNLELAMGDIIVAFAQDGSRRYWGPYVVGETPLPQWNNDHQEWLLILHP
jgi:hypothetical protein